MNDNFAKQLKMLRKKMGISQEELAEQLGVTPQSVSKWEGGKSYPDTAKLVEIAKFFKVSLDTLVFEDDAQTPIAKDDSADSMDRVEQALKNMQKSIDNQQSNQEKAKRSSEQSKRKATIIAVIVLCAVLVTVGGIFLGVYLYRSTPAYIFGAQDVSGGIEITALRNENRILKNGHLEIPSQINGKNVVSIGEHAFQGNQSIESVKIPDTVSIIGKNAFSSCKNLKTVDMGNGVKSIGVEAFAFCDGLETIKLSKYLEKIEMCAFSVMPNLKEIILPSNLSEIVKSAFWCTDLERVYFFGSEAEWNSISIHPGQNEGLLNAARYYYSETKPQSTVLNYFYFDKDGNIAHWEN